MMAFNQPLQTNSRGFLRSFKDAMQLAGKGTETLTWHRMGDRVVATIGGYVIETDQAGIEALKMQVKNARAKLRRNRHDTLGILGTMRKKLGLKPKANA